MLNECCEGVRNFLRACSETINDALSIGKIKNKFRVHSLHVTRVSIVVVFQKLNSRKGYIRDVTGGHVIN